MISARRSLNECHCEEAAWCLRWRRSNPVASDGIASVATLMQPNSLAMTLKNGVLIKRCVVFVFLFLCAMMLSLESCTNPFAPALGTGSNDNTLFGDTKTVDGVFQAMRYSYTFKDTLAYGSLLASNFTFTFRDYDKSVDVTWRRDEEMLITNTLFHNSQSLELVWNNIISDNNDSLLRSVTRSYNLTVTLNPQNVLRVDGRATFEMQRPNTKSSWKIFHWQDESF